MHWAAKSDFGKLEKVRFLVENGANVNTENKVSFIVSLLWDVCGRIICTPSEISGCVYRLLLKRVAKSAEFRKEEQFNLIVFR